MFLRKILTKQVISLPFFAMEPKTNTENISSLAYIFKSEYHRNIICTDVTAGHKYKSVHFLTSLTFFSETASKRWSPLQDQTQESPRAPSLPPGVLRAAAARGDPDPGPWTSGGRGAGGIVFILFFRCKASLRPWRFDPYYTILTGGMVTQPKVLIYGPPAVRPSTLKNQTVRGQPAGQFQKSNCTRPHRRRTIYLDFRPSPPPSGPYGLCIAMGT